MSDVTISIIIPVYNTEKYLKECLDSVINSIVDYKYEIIIINDGSNDNSESIILEYVNQCDNIIYYKQKNQGQGNARNLGIDKSSGKYIYFMDSDDFLKGNSLQILVERAENNNLEAVFFDGSSFFDKEYSGSDNYSFNYSRNRSYGFYQSGQELFVALSEENNFYVSPCLFILKRNVLIDNSIYFPKGVKNEDEFFTTILMFYIKSCWHTNDRFFFRRIRNSSTMTNTKKQTNYLSTIKILKLFDEVYSNLNFNTKEVKDAYFKKFEQIFRGACLTYNTYLKRKKGINNKEIMEIAKKYNYFSLKTKVFVLISNNYKLYSLLKYFKNKLYKIRRIK